MTFYKRKTVKTDAIRCFGARRMVNENDDKVNRKHSILCGTMTFTHTHKKRLHLLVLVCFISMLIAIILYPMYYSWFCIVLITIFLSNLNIIWWFFHWKIMVFVCRRFYHWLAICDELIVPQQSLFHTFRYFCWVETVKMLLFFVLVFFIDLYWVGCFVWLAKEFIEQMK